MKKIRIFLITTFFILTAILVVGLVAGSAKAADDCSTFSPLPPSDSKCCASNQCNDAALENDLYLRVYALDEDGNNIVGVPVTYFWVAVSPLLGNIETASTPTINGQSVAKLKLAPTADTASDKRVIVTATYGGFSRNYTFNILATCQSDPLLYYGIGGISRTGENNFQYSTAEVLSTCLDEYRLYEGDGKK